ncbi:MAG: Fic family protein [Phycisphaerales bacterium]|nr:Fic family protein [Phycisphaerales bacterium]
MERGWFSQHSPGRLVPITLSGVRPTPGGRVEADPIETVAFVPNPLPPDLDWGSLKASQYERLEAASAALGRVNGLVTLVPNARALLRSLWLREAKLSSEIENIQTTALDMVIAGNKSDTVEGDPARETFNAVTALERGLGADLPFSVDLIQSMHRDLLEDVRGGEKQPGAFRASQVYIGSPTRPERARFVPPPPGDGPDEIGGCMEALVAFVKSTPPEIPALAAVALMHYQFEAVHPFADGNGRIGRALIIHDMCRRGLLDQPVVFLSGYFEAHKQDYVNHLLRVSTSGDWDGWIGFFLDAVIHQAGQTVRLAERLIGLRSRFIERVQEAGAPARLLILIDELFRWPIATARGVSDLLGVTDPTARKDITTLVDLGVLEPSSEASYGQIWHAPAVLGLIEGAGDD